MQDVLLHPGELGRLDDHGTEVGGVLVDAPVPGLELEETRASVASDEALEFEMIKPTAHAA